MASQPNNPKAKHIRSFWPLVALIVIALIACAVIYLFAYGNVLQDEVNSSSFMSHFRHHSALQKTELKKPLAK